MKTWQRLVFMVAVTAALWALLFVLVTHAAGISVVTVTASPNEVDRNQEFLVTVLTAYPNATFNLTITGVDLTYTDGGRTNAAGFWQKSLYATFDFGEYVIRVDALNQTTSTPLRVGCSARCVLEIQQTWGSYIAAVVQDGYAKTIIAAVFVVAAIEIPRAAFYFYRQGRDAVRHGSMTAADALRAPLAFMHGFVQPGRMAMRQDVNDRIAVDLERRQLLEQLHDATQAKFREYDPAHLDAVQEIAADLKNAAEREARVTASLPPVAQQYQREKERMSETMEFAEMKAWADRENGKTMQDVLDAHELGVVRGRRNRARAGVVVFGLAGFLCSLMVTLVLAAYRGIYVDALRPLWVGVPDDGLKVIFGLMGVTVSIIGVEVFRLRMK